MPPRGHAALLPPPSESKSESKSESDSGPVAARVGRRSAAAKGQLGPEARKALETLRQATQRRRTVVSSDDDVPRRPHSAPARAASSSAEEEEEELDEAEVAWRRRHTAVELRAERKDYQYRKHVTGAQAWTLRDCGGADSTWLQGCVWSALRTTLPTATSTTL
jgi:hypothetical protein